MEKDILGGKILGGIAEYDVELKNGGAEASLGAEKVFSKGPLSLGGKLSIYGRLDAQGVADWLKAKININPAVDMIIDQGLDLLVSKIKSIGA